MLCVHYWYIKLYINTDIKPTNNDLFSCTALVTASYLVLKQVITICVSYYTVLNQINTERSLYDCYMVSFHVRTYVCGYVLFTYTHTGNYKIKIECQSRFMSILYSYHTSNIICFISSCIMHIRMYVYKIGFAKGYYSYIHPILEFKKCNSASVSSTAFEFVSRA